MQSGCSVVFFLFCWRRARVGGTSEVRCAKGKEKNDGRRGSVSGGRLVQPPLNSHPRCARGRPSRGHGHGHGLGSPRTTPTTHATSEKSERGAEPRKGGHAKPLARSLPLFSHLLSRPVALFLRFGWLAASPRAARPRRSSSVAAPTEPPSPPFSLPLHPHKYTNLPA